MRIDRFARLANFFYLSGQLDLAKETLGDFLEEEPNSCLGNLLLSVIYQQTNNPALNFKGNLLLTKARRWRYLL